MYKSIIPILKCPCCQKGFICFDNKMEDEEVIDGYIKCENDHTYFIREGVLDFNSKEQSDSNTWSEYFEEESPEDLDKRIENQKTENQKAIQNKFIEDIVDKTKDLKQGFLLDVASGRGMLLKKMIENINENVHIISTDLSFAVLLSDKHKFKNLNPKVKVSYIACDATKLPFCDNSIDRIVTFAGFINMLNLYEEGLKDSARVLKKDGVLVNSQIYVKEGTCGYQELEEVVKEHGIEDILRYIVKEKNTYICQKYFTGISEEISYEGICEKEDGDLLPIADEWFANVIISLKK